MWFSNWVEPRAQLAARQRWPWLLGRKMETMLRKHQLSPWLLLSTHKFRVVLKNKT